MIELMRQAATKPSISSTRISGVIADAEGAVAKSNARAVVDGIGINQRGAIIIKRKSIADAVGAGSVQRDGIG